MNLVLATAALSGAMLSLLRLMLLMLVLPRIFRLVDHFIKGICLVFKILRGKNLRLRLEAGKLDAVIGLTVIAGHYDNAAHAWTVQDGLDRLHV